MQLAIDIGNSTIKAACFERNHLVRHITISKDDTLENTFEPWLAGSDITHVGLSSVVPDLTQRVCCMLSAHIAVPILEIDHTVKLPFRIRYEYPDRLGSDRIAAAAGARFIYGAQSIIVVDAGTALTIDALRADGLFLGGSIGPRPRACAKCTCIRYCFPT